jgi:flagellar protein FliJ
MTPNTTALHRVLQHAESERDATLAQLTQVAEAQARLHSQQEQLQTYRRDYQARWMGQFRIAGTPEVMQHYQGFVERLNQALDQLEVQLAAAQRQATQVREQLIERETRVMAVKKLIERRDAEGMRHLALREQKNSDELAARIAWQRSPPMAAAAA